MPRPPRADEAGGLYHALNRGNMRATIFHKDADYEAFGRILYEGLQGHVYQQHYKSFPIQDNGHFFVVCRYVERNALRAGLVDRDEYWRWSSRWRWLRKPEPNPPLESLGHYRVFQAGPGVSTLLFRKRNWQRFVYQPSVPNHSATKAGSSRLHVASTWNQRCVHEVENAFASPKLLTTTLIPPTGGK